MDAVVGGTRPYSENASIASSIAHSLQNVREEWKKHNPNSPYSFAHCNQAECLIVDEKRDDFWALPDTDWENGSYEFSTNIGNVYFKWNDSYIATFNQIEYWSRK